MGKLIFLGTGAAIADSNQQNSQIYLEEGDHHILVDSGNSPIILHERGVDILRITDLILTHFHPDHVGTIPQLLMVMWLQGRRQPLHIYGLRDTLDRVEEMMNLYLWREWPGFFAVIFHRVSEELQSLLIHTPTIRVYASPVRHLLPTMGLRFDCLKSKKTIAYSSDTEPCPEMIALAQGVDILIHEGAGAAKGHSSPVQAAQVAKEADVRSLYLIHYSAEKLKSAQVEKEVHSVFSGKFSLAQDGLTLDF